MDLNLLWQQLFQAVMCVLRAVWCATVKEKFK